MGERLAHRGPDGEGLFHDDDIGLVHRRLAVVDPAGGQQPLRSQDGRFVLVANGEVYNHRELRRELGARGRCFTTGSDCEAILHVYAEFGTAGIERLHGMFAFALYDTRRRRLILGRDRLGIKPLFLARAGSAWIFASEMKALYPALSRSPQPNAAAVSQLLLNGWVQGPDQMLEGVRQLPPARQLVVERSGQAREHAYWELQHVAPFTGSENEAGERFDALFGDIMEEHVRADVPYGLLLSGGVDSGTLAALLSERQARPLQTFSFGFTGSGNRNELDDAQRLARRLGTEHTRIELDPVSIGSQLTEATWATDGIIQDPAVLPTLVLAREASRSLKVVFTGEGGDEVFAGYGRYRRRSLLKRFAARLDPAGGLGLPGGWPGDARRDCFQGHLMDAWWHRRAPQCGAWERTPWRWGAVRRRQAVDLQTRLPNRLLVKVDRALMAHGIEGRVPFLDHRVVEFGLSLPTAFKVRGPHKKYFLRHWAESYLPREQLYAGKRGFHVPSGRILAAALTPDVVHVLPQTRAVRGWFDADGIRRLLLRQERRGDVAGSVWAVLMFALWHALFVDGRGVPPASGVSIAEVLGNSVAGGRPASATGASPGVRRRA